MEKGLLKILFFLTLFTQISVFGSEPRLTDCKQSLENIKAEITSTSEASDSLGSEVNRRSRIRLWFQRSPTFSLLVRKFAEYASRVLPRTTYLDLDLLEDYLEAKTLLIGRFYKRSSLALDHIHEIYLPDAVILWGRLGYGHHLIKNVHQIIDGAEEIYFWEDGLLDKHSFSFLYELKYVLANPDLIARSYVIYASGAYIPLEEWAAENNLIDR